MKLRYILWAVTILLVGLLLLGQTKKHYQYQKEFVVQGNEIKVYNYITSHEWKRPILDPIDKETTDVKDFEIGKVTHIEYQGGKIFEEEPLELIPYNTIKWKHQIDHLIINSIIDLEEKGKVVTIEVNEDIEVTSLWLRGIFFYSKGSLNNLRDQFYDKLSTLIESYPDEMIRPSELK